MAVLNRYQARQKLKMKEKYFKIKLSYKNYKYKVYTKLKSVIKRENIFRTYNLRECRKRRVFLEDKYDFIPRENIKQFITEIDIGQEVVVED